MTNLTYLFLALTACTSSPKPETSKPTPATAPSKTIAGYHIDESTDGNLHLMFTHAGDEDVRIAIAFPEDLATAPPKLVWIGRDGTWHVIMTIPRTLVLQRSDESPCRPKPDELCHVDSDGPADTDIRPLMVDEAAAARKPYLTGMAHGPGDHDFSVTWLLTWDPQRHNFIPDAPQIHTEGRMRLKNT